MMSRGRRDECHRMNWIHVSERERCLDWNYCLCLLCVLLKPSSAEATRITCLCSFVTTFCPCACHNQERRNPLRICRSNRNFCGICWRNSCQNSKPNMLYCRFGIWTDLLRVEFHIFVWASQKPRLLVKWTAVAKILAAAEPPDEIVSLREILWHIPNKCVILAPMVCYKDFFGSLSSQRHPKDKSVLDDVNFIR